MRKSFKKKQLIVTLRLLATECSYAAHTVKQPIYDVKKFRNTKSKFGYIKRCV